jgi:hypothetical protein
MHHLTCLFLLFGSIIAGTSFASPEIQPNVVELLKPKLNSDRIEYFFGSYGVDPLDIDSLAFPFSRIANLHSLNHGKKIMRTLAVVDYFQPQNPSLCTVHREIVAGKSIGIALREDGWTIHKNAVYFGSISLSPNVMEWMDENNVAEGAAHFYRLEVSKANQEPIPYCTILEIHSPQYLTQEWLQALYADQYALFSQESKESSELIARLVLLMQDFPSTTN